MRIFGVQLLVRTEKFPRKIFVFLVFKSESYFSCQNRAVEAFQTKMSRTFNI